MLPPSAAGLYVVFLAIDRVQPNLRLYPFDGQVSEPSPGALRGLPGLLAAHGWRAGQAIVIAADFTHAASPGRDAYWAAVTGALAGLASDMG